MMLRKILLNQVAWAVKAGTPIALTPVLAGVVRILRRVAFFTERRGISGLLKLLYDYYGRRHRYLVYEFDLGTSRPTLVSRDPALCVSVGTVAQLEAWRQNATEVTMPFLRDLTDGWKDFWWAWHESRLAGIVWVIEKPPFIRLKPNEVGIVDLFVVPAFRGRGIGKALVSEACRAMRDGGATRVYATVDAGNLSSRHLFETLGFSRVADLQLRGKFVSHTSPTRLVASDAIGNPHVSE